MPAEFTSDCGDNGLSGSGSIGETFGGCCELVSQEPSSSETRRRLSLNNAVSFSFSPGTGFGTGDCALGRGPGSCALKVMLLFCPTTISVGPPANRTAIANDLREMCLIFFLTPLPIPNHNLQVVPFPVVAP